MEENERKGKGRKGKIRMGERKEAILRRERIEDRRGGGKEG